MITDLRRDTYVLGVLESPGVCEIVGAGEPRKWDEQAGFGLSGASLVGGSEKLSHFSIKHTIWEPPGPTSPQWIDWEKFKPLVTKPLPGIRPPALGIYHPILADVGISLVVVEDRTQWLQDEFGAWTMTVKFIKFKSPQLFFAKAAPGIPAGQQGVPTAESIHSDGLAASLRRSELARGTR